MFTEEISPDNERLTEKERKESPMSKEGAVRNVLKLTNLTSGTSIRTWDVSSVDKLYTTEQPPLPSWEEIAKVLLASCSIMNSFMESVFEFFCCNCCPSNHI